MAEKKDTPKTDAAEAARERAAERDEQTRSSAEDALAQREADYQASLVEIKPSGIEATTPNVRAPRLEEAADATTQVAIENLKERERLRDQEIERLRSSADAARANANRPVVVTDAVLRSAQAASAAAEAAVLRLDEVTHLGAVYTVNGVAVDANGVPIKQ